MLSLKNKGPGARIVSEERERLRGLGCKRTFLRNLQVQRDTLSSIRFIRPAMTGREQLIHFNQYGGSSELPGNDGSRGYTHSSGQSGYRFSARKSWEL